jgi:hypothetical protein
LPTRTVQYNTVLQYISPIDTRREGISRMFETEQMTEEDGKGNKCEKRCKKSKK